MVSFIYKTLVVWDHACAWLAQQWGTAKGQGREGGAAAAAFPSAARPYCRRAGSELSVCRETWKGKCHQVSSGDSGLCCVLGSAAIKLCMA